MYQSLVGSLPSSSLLSPGDSPRSHGQDATHVTRLAELDGPLSPILVARRTVRTVDGNTSPRGGAGQGGTVIDVEFFDGTNEDAFVRAVEANVRHGLPLSLDDRRAHHQDAPAHVRPGDRRHRLRRLERGEPAAPPRA